MIKFIKWLTMKVNNFLMYMYMYSLIKKFMTGKTRLNGREYFL